MLPEYACFFTALRELPPIQVQARLLNTADRDLAALMNYMSLEERLEVLGFLSGSKRRRIEDELERMRHVKLALPQLTRLASHLSAHLSGRRPLGSASRYFRPTR